jgi:hypothetical protein
MRAWLAMGKPDLTAMTAQGNYDGKIVLALTTMLVLCGALSLFMGGSKVKDAMDDDIRKQKMNNDIGQQMREGQEDLDAILRIIRK